MALQQEIPEAALIEMEKQYNSHHRLMLATPYYVEATKGKRKIQRGWLETFKIVLSPTIACRRTGVSDDQYRAWRDRDPVFCRMMNEVLVTVREELAGAAIGRAFGEAIADEEGNHAVDAAGRPIYRHGSDRLMVALLGLEQKEKDADVLVNIEIVSR